VIDTTKASGKRAYVKFVGDEARTFIVVDHIDSGGIWFRDEALAIETFNPVGRPLGLEEKYPLIFVPYHRIDWMAFPQKDFH
jgi:hypothetical protein